MYYMSNMQEDQLVHANWIFFLYQHMDHNLYETTMAYILKTNKSYGYIKSTNIKRIEKEIMDHIQGGTI